MRLVHDKIVFCDKFVKKTHFSRPVFLGSRKKGNREYRKRTQDENLAFSALRAKNRLIDLIRSNPDLNVMLSLTYENPGQSLVDCNKDFKKFILRMNYYVKGFKYVAVPELQKKRLLNLDQYAIHYHLLINVNTSDYFDFSFLQNNIWGHGFVNTKYLSGSADYPALYISKYLTKDFIDNDNIREFNHRFYYSSKNLKKPVTYYGFDSDLIYKFYEEVMHLLTVDKYVSKFCGLVEVKKSIMNVDNIEPILEEINDLILQQQPATLLASYNNNKSRQLSLFEKKIN